MLIIDLTIIQIIDNPYNKWIHTYIVCKWEINNKQRIYVHVHIARYMCLTMCTCTVGNCIIQVQVPMSLSYDCNNHFLSDTHINVIVYPTWYRCLFSFSILCTLALCTSSRRCCLVVLWLLAMELADDCGRCDCFPLPTEPACRCNSLIYIVYTRLNITIA